MTNFLWGVYPYLCLVLFFIVPVIRMVFRPYAWSTRATSLFSNKLLGVASLFFHWGIFLLFLGHAAGLIGGVMGYENWVVFFYWSGLIGGLMALFGSIIALYRRWSVPEVRAMSQTEDYLVHLFIIPILAIALYQVIFDRVFGVAFTASSWFASLWAFSPQPELMESATFLTKLHIVLALTFLAYFPFTKLVHLWSLPINYFVRPYQSMRTARYQFQRKWEFALRSDKSVLVYGLLFFAVGAIAVSTFLGVPRHESVAKQDGMAGNGANLAGYALYVSQCARCHGMDGLGNGLGAESPTFGSSPRNLVEGHFRFISTDNGVASDADLFRVLSDGLPSSGMPPFGALTGQQLTSLVGVLNGFWKDRPAAGNLIAVGEPPQITEQMRDGGKQLFQSICSACHGQQGRGDGPAAVAIVDWKGNAVAPADLSSGMLKSGRDLKQIYLRIASGIPGGKSGWLMPPFAGSLTSEQIWSVVGYLEQSILPPRLASVAANGANRR
ncbi:MAG: respiratory nitrate reductase subunit gamma [bacterium]